MHDISNIFRDNPPVIIYPVVMYCLDCWSQFPKINAIGESVIKCFYCESTNIREFSDGV